PTREAVAVSRASALWTKRRAFGILRPCPSSSVGSGKRVDLREATVQQDRPRRPHTGRADVHLHTDVVDGLQSVAQLLEYAEDQTDLDVVAITDHDEIRGALDARDLSERRNLRVRVITGTEVTTRHGHLLALFVEQKFPMLKTIDATLAAIHAAGGVAIVPHPMSWLTTSIGERTLRRIHALGEGGRRSGVYFDAIEMLNPSVAGRVACRRAADLNRTLLHLPVMAGSDAHASNLIGSAYTTFPGRTPDDLRAAFAAHTTQGHGRFWTFNEHREIAAASLYKAWVLVPVRKTRQVVGRFGVRGSRFAVGNDTTPNPQPEPDR
ncbi:MAG: PHP domain-containing protein, partial [Thermomicrobia bacterium]|nr:PHP domain-containing protein [Thermomicrobia bacterium]